MAIKLSSAALSQAIREKTRALMTHERGAYVEQPRGHRQWLMPLGERRR